MPQETAVGAGCANLDATVCDSIAPAEITLPHAVAGTPLIIEKLVSYEGAFIEDKSGEEVVNIAAILLRNTGDIGIQKAAVTLERGALVLNFEASAIPPGSSVLVLEKNRKACKQQNFTGCSGWTDIAPGDWLQKEILQIEMADKNTLSITNLSEYPLNSICLFYKTVYADDLFYIGGITYQTCIEKLTPGECVSISPEWYAGAYSAVVRVTFDMRSEN